MDVVVRRAAVVPAEEPEAPVRERSGVVTPCAGRDAARLAGFVLEGDYFRDSGKGENRTMKSEMFGRRERGEGRTEVEEEQLVGVLGPVVSTHDEEVRPDLCSCVCQSAVGFVCMYGAPMPCVCLNALSNGEQKRGTISRTKVQTKDIRERLPPIAPTDDDHDVPHQVRGMVPTRRRPRPRRALLLPPHPIGRHRHVEHPHIVQRHRTVPTSEHHQPRLV